MFSEYCWSSLVEKNVVAFLISLLDNCQSKKPHPLNFACVKLDDNVAGNQSMLVTAVLWFKGELVDSEHKF